MKQLRTLLSSWEALLVVLLLLAIVIGSTVSPYFLTGFNASSLTRDLMEKAIMALPMTLIIIAGEIDLSVASTLGLASVVLGVTWHTGDWPLLYWETRRSVTFQLPSLPSDLAVSLARLFPGRSSSSLF